MLNNDIDRAKQFLPFDALKGFREALECIEEDKKGKKILLEDSEDIINDVIIDLKKGDRVIVKYYYGFDYIETIGFIKKVDTVYKCLFLLDSKIDFDDIIGIEKV